MKKFLLLTTLFGALLYGCGDNNEEVQKEEVEETKDEQKVEKEEKGSRASIEEVKSSAIFTTPMQSKGNTVNLYVVPVSQAVEFVDSTTAFSSEGNVVSEGTYAFFIEEIGKRYAMLVEGMEEVPLTINLSDSPFNVHTFNNYSLLSYAETEASISSTYQYWIYKDEQLQSVLIDKNKTFSAFSQPRFIDDEFMQKRDYYNADEIGWIYTTYKWNEERNNFEVLAKKEMFSENSWENGTYENEQWNANPNYTLPFARFELNGSLKLLAAKGQLVKGWPGIGEPIAKLLAERPNVLNGFYDYTYPNGINYVGEESIEQMVLLGESVVDHEDPEKLRQMIGSQVYEEYGGGSAMYYDTYHKLGEFIIILSSDGEDKLTHLTIQRNDGTY